MFDESKNPDCIATKRSNWHDQYSYETKEEDDSEIVLDPYITNLAQVHVVIQQPPLLRKRGTIDVVPVTIY